jgi:hypothetical protein
MAREERKMKHIGFLLGAAMLAAAPALAEIPLPQVTGPVAAPDVPGTASHNYIFFASNHDLAAHGYVEEEYFIKGTATTYDINGPVNATVKDTGQSYYTRVVVRRPADPRRFNGAVLVEWDNVTNQFDAENVWFFDWEHMMRAGYAWVGVSPQTVGVAALKKWSPARYGEFDVGKAAAGTGQRGGPDADAMSYDIYSQVGAALKHPGAIDMLHGLKPKTVIATGESQSAARLTTYVNSVHPLARVFDGFLLLSTLGSKIRDDLAQPVFKVNTEYDTVASDAPFWQPDTPKFRSWDVAGTSHVDQHLRASREPLELRDNGVSLEANMAPLCANPQIGTRVPTGYVVASAFDKLVTWIQTGKAPPSAPHLKITQVNQRPQPSVVARDSDGLAEGGIRLSALAVPSEINVGLSAPADPTHATGGGEAIGSSACVRWGYSVDMGMDALNARYPSHAAYVAAVKKVTDRNVKDGYLLAFDGAAIIREAQESHIGR